MYLHCWWPGGIGSTKIGVCPITLTEVLRILSNFNRALSGKALKQLHTLRGPEYYSVSYGSWAGPSTFPPGQSKARESHYRYATPYFGLDELHMSVQHMVSPHRGALLTDPSLCSLRARDP